MRVNAAALDFTLEARSGGPIMKTVDPHRVILTGENPFIRLSGVESEAETTHASFWRIITSPAGPGHVLYLKSELTDNCWLIYSDNIALARWLQSTVQGMLNAETKDPAIPVIGAQFNKSGDPRYFWTESVTASGDELLLTWHDFGDAFLMHTQPDADPVRPYGVCTVLIPSRAALLTRNGTAAKGRVLAREREGHPHSSCALAFSESWTEAR